MDLLIGDGHIYGLFGFLVVDFLIGDGDSYGLFGFLVVDFLTGDGDSYGLFGFLVVSFFGQNLKTCPEPPQFLQVWVGQYSVVWSALSFWHLRQKFEIFMFPKPPIVLN